MSSPINKLRKILKLEIELNYENRAVVGGLEKFMPSWKAEAASTQLGDDLIETVTNQVSNYKDATVEERAKIISSLFEILNINAGIDASTSSKDYQPKSQPTKQPQSSAQTKRPSGTPAAANKPSTIKFGDAPANIGLNAPLTVIPGIGPGNAKKLSNLGLSNLGDILYYFPRRYDDYSKLKPISRIEYGEELTLVGSVEVISTRPIRNQKQKITEAVLSDGTGSIRLTWFNSPWIENNLKAGQQIVLSGKVDMYLGRHVINNPEWEYIDSEHLHTNRIVPVYPLTAGVTQKWLRRIVYQTVNFWAPRLGDFLPQEIRESADLIELTDALLQAHFPDDNEKLKAARERLAFDEIFLLQLGVLRQKQSWQSETAKVFSIEDSKLTSMINSLAFELTGAQKQTLSDIRLDLASGKPMNRLIQGDVGSGKTIVAALAMLIVAMAGDQAAFMAPTGILAEQHYRSILNLIDTFSGCEDIPSADQVCLLVGDTSASDKQEIYSALEEGRIKLVIGTHALIEDPVKFQSLQLVIVDEQHRFGVAQRSALRTKGNNPHLLVMTATPIPRSLALTVYGDLDLSVMDELPVGRQPVETFVLHPLERERAYQLIRTQVSQGRQVFIIYPLIEQTENGATKAAVDEQQRLQTDVFPDLTIGLLHGRMRPEEKDDTMRRFREGEFPILVSTSVIEVGVDVPNATVMLIEGANRFGLAQLHQFRGRVGRGADKSVCLLIPESENSLENERLAVMAETNDGFILAERDLEQRGPGEFLGTRQSGFCELRMANIMDVRLIEKARRHALGLFEIDPELKKPDHHDLVTILDRFWSGSKGDIS